MIVNVKPHHKERAREKMQNPHIFLGAVLFDGGVIAAEFRSESGNSKGSYLSIFMDNGECLHRCAAYGPCWHLGVASIASGLVFGREINSWKRHNEWPEAMPPGGRDITFLLAGRHGTFEQLFPDERLFSLEENKEEKCEETDLEKDEQKSLLEPEDSWLVDLNLPYKLFSRILEFRERQKKRLWDSPESWKRIPNLGGDDLSETPFAEWMEAVDLETVRDSEYIPQDSELIDALVPLLYPESWSPTLLIGPKSSGKTTLAYYLARILCLPITPISGSTDTNEEKLVGYHDLVAAEKGIETRFVPGALLEPVVSGEMLVFNEINQALPDVISVMNDLLDWQKAIHVKGMGEVRPGENFRLVGTMNPGYIGTSPLNQALEDRFRRVDVPYPPKEVVSKLIPQYGKELSELYSRIVQRVETGEIDEEVISIRSLIRCAEEIKLVGEENKKRIITSNLCSGMQDRNTKQILADIIESMF